MELKDHKKEPMCSVKAPFVLSEAWPLSLHFPGVADLYC